MSSPASKEKVAFITGVTGQDGSYLAEFLLSKGYVVHGLVRKASTFNTHRIDHLIQNMHDKDARFFFHYGDLLDIGSLQKLLLQIRPDEIYNLAAQSHVRFSFDHPVMTGDCTGLGALRLLEAIRTCGLEKSTRFYQASTSELFGESHEIQNEESKLNPCSPYAIAKLFAHYSTINHRNAYGMYATAGILFNHESPRRGETFVTRKITMGVAAIVTGRSECFYLGYLDSKRDWGHAKDYVEVMWLLLQQDTPKDYVISTGRTHTVRYFVEQAFKVVNIEIVWEGEGIDEVGKNAATGDVYIRIDPRYFRPTEVPFLCGDSSLARKELGWTPRISLEEMIEEMVKCDIEAEGHSRTSDRHPK